MTRFSVPILAVAVSALAFGARADSSVTVNYDALKHLPPKESAAGVAVPKLVPPSLVGRSRVITPARPDPLANPAAATGTTPPAAFETHEALYNSTDTSASDASIQQVFARSSVVLATPTGVSATTAPQQTARQVPARATATASRPIEVANAQSEPVADVSWDRARPIGEILFHANGQTLRDIDRGSLAELDQLAQRIGPSQTRVLLRAFGGTAGDDSHQAHLVALMRGLAVRKYLIARGVPSICIDVNAMGGAKDGGPLDRVDVMAGAT